METTGQPGQGRDQPAGDQGTPELIDIIRREIAAAGGRITFARFMELALYHPQYGYYRKEPRDYQTSPELHPLFGTLIARQLEQLWEALDRPAPFQVVEMGAGRGHLARSILAYFGREAPAADLHYIASDIGPRPAELPGNAEWRELPLAEWPPSIITGCFLSNELVDAFPVHRVMMQGGELQEVYVVDAGQPSPALDQPSSPSLLPEGEGSPKSPLPLGEGQGEGRTTGREPVNEGAPFREALGPPSTPELSAYFDWLGIALPGGHRAEVNLQARRWMVQVARTLSRGFIITIDYGYPAEELYARPQGTLLCYHQQQFNNDPYRWVGQQDITAHVDFSALADAGRESRLHFSGLVSQAEFLRNLGLEAYQRSLEQAQAAGRITPAQLYDQRSALREMVDRRGLGAFRVLAQHKGVVEPALGGLDPTNRRKRVLWSQPPRWPW